MSVPARAGLSIFAKDSQRLANFYENILGMSRLHESAEVIVLQSPDIQFVIHRIPTDRALNVIIDTPPQLHDSALKFFFTVPSVAVARSAAREQGGDVALEQWKGSGFVVYDAYDPEGNVFHMQKMSLNKRIKSESLRRR